MAIKNTTNVSIRMDKDLKREADFLFAELGMSMSTAFNIFVKQVVREGGIPFMITSNKPNKKTILAMEEAERITSDSTTNYFSNVDDALHALKYD